MQLIQLYLFLTNECVEMPTRIELFQRRNLVSTTSYTRQITPYTAVSATYTIYQPYQVDNIL